MNNGLVLRQQKGQALTHEEVDNNFRICDNSFTMVQVEDDNGYRITAQNIVDTLDLKYLNAMFLLTVFSQSNSDFSIDNYLLFELEGEPMLINMSNELVPYLEYETISVSVKRFTETRFSYKS